MKTATPVAGTTGFPSSKGSSPMVVMLTRAGTLAGLLITTAWGTPLGSEKGSGYWSRSTVQYSQPMYVATLAASSHPLRHRPFMQA